MQPRISQKDVAKAAGVHPTTVSLALRNSPRLPAETRERILAIAEKLGYAPDPLLDALNAYRLAGRERRFQGVIAWLDCWADHPGMFRTGVLAKTFQTAKAHCEANGFNLEEFSLGPGGYTWQRLGTVLRERGVQGVIVPPVPGGRAHLRFRWEWFSNLAIGYSLARPELHRAAHDNYSNMRLLIRGVRLSGRRRIGLVMLRHEHLRTDTLRYAAYRTLLHASEGDTEAETVPTLWVDDMEHADVAGWFKKHRPEAILVHNAAATVSLLRAGGVRVPEDVIVVTCGAHEYPGMPGIVEDNDHLLRVAVEHLAAMIRRGERGLPEKPLRLVVSGEWSSGSGEFELKPLAPARSPQRAGK